MTVEAAPRARLTVPIVGMSCAACVARVETALRGIPGVAAASVDLATERAQVVATPAVTLAALRAAVQGVGYDVPLVAAEDQAPAPPSRPGETPEARPAFGPGGVPAWLPGG